MSKAVMLSVRPKWCEQIVNGEKTVEVRKTRPNPSTPFRVYIYCTRDKHLALIQNRAGANLIACMDAETAIPVGGFAGNGKVIGEFVCDRTDRLARVGFDGSGEPAKYCICNSDMSVWPVDGICEEACLTQEELEKYLGGYEGYGLHISGLKVYDTPKELSEFRKACAHDWYCDSCAMHWENNGTCGNESLRLKRPPQSWCYVEEVE